MSNKKRRPGRPAKYPPEFQRDAVAMFGHLPVGRTGVMTLEGTAVPT